MIRTYTALFTYGRFRRTGRRTQGRISADEPDPLIGESASERAESGSNKSHSVFSFQNLRKVIVRNKLNGYSLKKPCKGVLVQLFLSMSVTDVFLRGARDISRVFLPRTSVLKRRFLRSSCSQRHVIIAARYFSLTDVKTIASA